mmetsp:Transcript_29326/g.80480  ORF Transcript_29326/g.80480 Transcript_29326/m.80480 type:complete len:202 (-) Transcript_29326:387-992(-)
MRILSQLCTPAPQKRRRLPERAPPEPVPPPLRRPAVAYRRLWRCCQMPQQRHAVVLPPLRARSLGQWWGCCRRLLKALQFDGLALRMASSETAMVPPLVNVRWILTLHPRCRRCWSPTSTAMSAASTMNWRLCSMPWPCSRGSWRLYVPRPGRQTPRPPPTPRRAANGSACQPPQVWTWALASKRRRLSVPQAPHSRTSAA